MVADANLNGVSDVHKRAAGKVPVINATTQILQESGKAIVIATVGAEAPREDTARADTAKTTVGVASGRIDVGVIPAMIVMIVAAPIEGRAAPTGVTGKIIGGDAVTIVMTAGILAGDSAEVAGVLIVITVGITATIIGGMNAGNGKRKRRAPESILSGFGIPVTVPKNGATIMNPRFRRQ